MNLGQVYTKRVVADYMVGLFTLKGKAKVLDPCFGYGVFINSLLKKTEFLIDGVEIDEKSFSLFDNPNTERCSLKNCDFFDIEDRYDGIIMNPPYVRQEELNALKPLGVSKQKLQTSCGLMTISSKANLYMYFILRSILLLRDGGELIAIFPNSWTNTPVGKQFYEQICHHGCITDFINVEGEAFEGSPMVDVCILKFVRGESGNTVYKQMTISPTDVLSIIIVDKLGEKKTAGLVKLQTVAKVRRGITTGFNKLFVNPTLFTCDHLVEILSSPKDIQGFSTNHCKLDTMLAIKDGDVLNEDETNYLENCSSVILKEGKPQTLKSMIEKGQPWYYITLPETAQIIFSYIVRNNLKFVLNEGRCNVRDNFYMISSSHNQYLLLALLNNYHVFTQLELCGKSYGKGVLKLQTYDISDIKIPHPTALSKEDTDRLIKLSEDLVASSDEDKIEVISDILNPYYGVEDAKDKFLELKSKRLAKYE